MVRSCFVVGRSFATLVVVLSLTACHKDPPHRGKRLRAHPASSSTAAGSDDDSPPPPPPPPVPPPVPAAPAPVAAAPVAPVPPPPVHARRQLTVDRTVSSRPPAAAPPPAAPAPEYKAVNDKPPPSPSSSSRCEGGSAKGERLSVQGVAADDVLNVRESPDKTSAILGELPSDATGVHGTANRRRIGASTWREVECGKLRGWVNERFLAHESGN